MGFCTNDYAINLVGVIFDLDFNLIPQINSIVKSCNYHMHKFKCIHKHLDQDTAISVANAIAGSCIDYCNSLFIIEADTHNKKAAENTKPSCMHHNPVPQVHCMPRNQVLKIPQHHKTSFCTCSWSGPAFIS